MGILAKFENEAKSSGVSNIQENRNDLGKNALKTTEWFLTEVNVKNKLK